MQKGTLLSLIIILSISTAALAFNGDMGTGTQPLTDGTEDYPWLIEDYDDFVAFCGNTDYWASGVHTRLECNLDLSVAGTYSQAPIAGDINADSTFDGIEFAGQFNGNNKIINHLYIDGSHYCGLFGQISLDSEIIDLGFEECSILGSGRYVGILCGYNLGSVSRCHSTGTVSGYLYNGGLVGCNGDGNINLCYAECTVNGSSSGGLCGYNTGMITDCHAEGIIGGIKSGGLCGVNSGTIIKCHSTGNMIGGDSVGGLCGKNNGTIKQCYATGSIVNDDHNFRYAGGLCGENDWGSAIINCYSTGSISCGVKANDLGGLCGYSVGRIINCYSIGRVNAGGYGEYVDGSYRIGGLCSYGEASNSYYYQLGGPFNGIGTDLDAAQMQNYCNFEGFDFVGNSDDGTDEIWSISEGHCPKLAWQNDNGPVITSFEINTTLSGTGHFDDPFLISSLDDFNEFRSNPELRYGYFLLTTDLDLRDTTFTEAVIGGVFGGHFDGGNHVISNILIEPTEERSHYNGLFHSVAGYIRNLGVEDITINAGGYYAGGLCCRIWSGEVFNCYVNGDISGNRYSIYWGGLCGRNDGIVRDCHAAGTIIGRFDTGGLCGHNRGYIINSYTTNDVSGIGESGSENMGGLCGYNYSGSICNCYSTGNVNGYASESIGGLCGRNSSIIINCFAAGAVNGGYGVGGFCGLNRSSISNCYSVGLVMASSTGEIGGFCGSSNNDTGIVINCLWDIETSGMDDGVGGRDDSCGVNGFATSQMQSQNTYLESGWDFRGETTNGICEVWQIPLSGGYPVLSYFNGYSPVTLKGGGTREQPFLIHNATELGAIYHYGINFSYKLKNNISLENINNSYAFLPLFAGRFDGDGYVISNLEIEGGDYLGLFGKIIGTNTEITNLGVIDARVICNGDDYYSRCHGIICGEINSGRIRNCFVTGEVKGLDRWIGGLCGKSMYASSISQCYADVIIRGDQYVGGICGENDRGIMTNCYSTGTIAYYGGGLCGFNRVGIIDTCYSTVTSSSNSSYLSPICETNNGGDVSNCFWDSEVTDIYNSDEGIGLTTVEMKSLSTFTDAGWDFTNLWWINEGRDYPKLYYQPFGDLDNDSHVNLTDLAVMAAAWMSIEGDANYNSVCELSGDTAIDSADLTVLSEMWLVGPWFWVSDINSDYRIDLADFGLFTAAYLATPSDVNWNAACNFNDDEIIDITDLQTLSAEWLKGF